MSTQKRFSKLAIAAGILLTASATGFAQTDSNISQTQSTESAVVAINKAPRFEVPSASSKLTTNAISDVTATKTTLSAARFMESAKDSFVKPSVTSSPEFRMEISNTQEFNAQNTAKRVEFVPSRNPKTPW